MKRSYADWVIRIGLLLGLGAGHAAPQPRSFTVATYNVENYLVTPTATRPVKSAEAQARVRESILALRPDVLALQEIGPPAALEALRTDLRQAGLDYPHREHVEGFDTNIFVAVLSQHPIVARRPHTDQTFLLYGRRFRTSRGFAEVEIQVGTGYRFTLLAAHLKSRRETGAGDQAEIREQEALCLRRILEARLKANPDANLALVGDFNDHPDSPALRILRGRGARAALIDTRPAERNGDDQPNPDPRFPPRHVTWTHFYGREDVYSRVDYILLSPGMAREWDRSGTYVLASPNWGLASDHRPVIARFHTRDP